MADFGALFKNGGGNVNKAEKLGNYKVTYLHYTKLVKSPYQYREFSQEDIDSIVDLITAAGSVLQPVLVRKIDADEYEIIAGHQRCEGIRYLVEKMRLEKYALVPCMITNMDDVDAELNVVVSNIRKVQTPYETLHQINVLRRQIKKYPERFPDLPQKGTVAERVALRMGMSRTVVSEYVKISNNLGEKGMELFAKNEIDKSAAMELAGFPEEEQEELIGKGILTYAEIKKYRKEKDAKAKENMTAKEIRETDKPAEEALSFFGLPKTVRPEGSLITTVGCGDGKHDCYSCYRDCGIRQEERRCRTATMGKPFSCTQTGDLFKRNMEHSLYREECQFFYPELAPVRAGDKEPVPCCLTCANKSCFPRCDIAKKRDEEERKAAEAAKRQEEREREAAKPEPTDRDIKAFYDWNRSCLKETEITADGLKQKFHNFREGDGTFDYQGSARGVRINYKREITWAQAAKRLKEIQEKELGAEKKDCATSHTEPEAVAAELEPHEAEEKSIDSLNLSSYTREILNNAGINTVAQLRAMDREHLVKVRSMSNRRLEEIKKALVGLQEDTIQPEDMCGVARAQELDVIDGECRECCDGTETPTNSAKTQRKDMDVLRDMLMKEKADLEEWVKVDKVDPLPPEMIQKKKLLVDALASMLCDLEDGKEQEESPQPELPLFKNNDQRKEWLRNYKDWGLWYEDSHIGVKYYKYQFDNGAALVAEVYHQPATRHTKEYDASYLHLIGGPEPPKGTYGIGKWAYHKTYCRQPNSETELIEFLKEIQKENTK